MKTLFLDRGSAQGHSGTSSMIPVRRSTSGCVSKSISLIPVKSINEVSSRDLSGLEDSILVLVSTVLLSKWLLAGELPTDLDAGFSLSFNVKPGPGPGSEVLVALVLPPLFPRLLFPGCDDMSQQLYCPSKGYLPVFVRLGQY